MGGRALRASREIELRFLRLDFADRWDAWCTVALPWFLGGVGSVSVLHADTAGLTKGVQCSSSGASWGTVAKLGVTGEANGEIATRSKR